MENTKRVITSQELELKEDGVKIPEGTVFTVESASEQGIVLSNDEAYYMVTLDVFEQGFEIYMP